MISDTTLDKLLKETIVENLVKDPGKEFTFQTVSVQTMMEPMISSQFMAKKSAILKL